MKNLLKIIYIKLENNSRFFFPVFFFFLESTLNNLQLELFWKINTRNIILKNVETSPLNINRTSKERFKKK